MSDYESAFLPGYTGMPPAEETLTRIGVVEAVRVEGQFWYRGKHAVGWVSDGWLCKGEDGYLFGVEDSEKSALFDAAANPPDGFEDTVVALPDAQVGVAYDEDVDPPDNGAHAVTFAQKAFGTIYSGLTLNRSDPQDVTVTGTPDAGGTGWCYFEVTFNWDNGNFVVQRYCMRVLPAA